MAALDGAPSDVSRGILHVIPRWIGGGPERSVLAMARQTAALGVEHRHTVVVLDPPLTSTMVLQARRLGVELVVRPGAPELCRLAAKADVVQVHYWNHPALAASLRSVELPPARILVWCHVLGTNAPQVLTADIARFADRLLVTNELSLASEGCRVALADGTPVDVVPGIHDPTRLDGFAARPHRGCVVGYIGVVNDAKLHSGYADLCGAVADPNIRFEVYGGGGGEAELRRRLAELGIAGRVDVRGPTEDIRSALEGFDIFGYPLAPGCYATSEKALQEAMWVGIPPVVFAHGGPGTMVVDGESGLVAPDEGGYVAAIERLASDPGLRARLGAGAQRRARAVFDPARHVARIIDIIEAMAVRPRRTRLPLPGGSETPAAGFVRSLGDRAGPFAVSLLGPPAGAALLAAADRLIATSSTLVAHSEGGVVHHRNAAATDPHLRLWCGLVATGAGDGATAAAEFGAVEAFGLGDDRPARYVRLLRHG